VNRLSLIVLAAALVACADEQNVGDAGVPGNADAASTDATSTDAAAPDAGASTADTGAPDAGASTADSGAPDASAQDPDAGATGLAYPVIDTAQASCYDVGGRVIACGGAPSGQDAEYTTHVTSFVNNGDGTVSDNVTGLHWQRHHSAAMAYSGASGYCDGLDLGGHQDWRLPDIRELYSLIDFNGHTGIQNDRFDNWTPANWKLFLDGSFDVNDASAVFIQEPGNRETGGRILDCQVWSSSDPVGTTLNADDSVLGGNFCDGRIKAYPKRSRKFTKCVRSGSGYAQNAFRLTDGDTTVADDATGLVWTRAYSNDATAFPQVTGLGEGDGSMGWADALAFCEGLDYAGHTDWKLPDIKELQSIVAYDQVEPVIDTRYFHLAAVDRPDHCNGGTFSTYPYFWSSTTHVEYSVPMTMISGEKAAYIAFGKSWGSLNNGATWVDAHGPGAQRSDPKSGDPASRRVRCGFGPQSDYIGINNWVRCVRER